MQTSGVQKPVRARVVLVDDAARDPRRVRRACARTASCSGLEDAARSRSEADWLVGMNATRAADHAGRLAAQHALAGPGADPDPGADRRPRHRDRALRAGGLLAGARDASRRRPGEQLHGPLAQGLEQPAQGGRGGGAHRRRRAAAPTAASRRSRQKPIVEQSQLLYDLTTLQREANQRFGFTADRTLRAAQALYDQHKVLTYPRTSSRYLSSDMYPQPAVDRRARRPRPTRAYADGARYVREPRPAAARAASSTTPGSPTTTRSSRPTTATTSSRLSSDERRIYDLVAKRFLAVFHPPARFEQTTVTTDRRRRELPLAGQGADRRRLARRLRRDRHRGARGQGRRRGRAGAAAARGGAARRAAPRPRCWPSRRSRRRATPSRRCCARWRPPASSWRTTRPRRP